MDAVEVIESRVAALEEKLFGKTRPMETITPLASNLSDANSKMVTALAQRDSINSVLNRLDQLEQFMDPMYITQSGLSAEAKLELVSSAEDEMTELLAKLEEVKNLVPALDSEHIKEVPAMNSQLEKLTLAYLDFKGKTDKQTGDVQELLKKYNEIVNLISASFVKWDEVITDYEIAATPKKIID